MATGCAFPDCGLPPSSALRGCSSCDGTVHHACFAQFCFDHKLPDPEGNSAYCWACVLKDPCYKKFAGLSPPADKENGDAVDPCDEESASGIAPSNDDGTTQVGVVADDGGVVREDVEGEEQVQDGGAEESQNANAPLESLSDKREADKLGTHSNQVLSDGTRVLMSFGVPPAWYGGIVKLPRTIDDRTDDSSTTVYIAFDDGELRNFATGMTACELESRHDFV